LGTDGLFVVSDLGQTVDLNAGLELNSIPLFQYQGSSSPIADPIHLTGLSDLGSGLISDNTALSLADGGFGLFSGVARVPASVLNAAGDTESIASNVLGGAGPLPSSGSSFTESLAPLQGQSSDSVGLSEIPPAHVIWTAAGTDGSDGSLSSGDTLNFGASPPVQIDDLFSGNRYTDYNMTLQGRTPDAGKIGVAPTNDTVDHAIVSPAPVDITPLKGMPATNTPLDHAPTVTEELVGHSHTI
jgi:hypothetical protein